MDKKKMLPDNLEATATKADLPEKMPESATWQNDELKSALAAGLPAWSIEPPAVMIRRKARTL